jgi:hypothetical protein
MDSFERPAHPIRLKQVSLDHLGFLGGAGAEVLRSAGHASEAAALLLEHFQQPSAHVASGAGDQDERRWHRHGRIIDGAVAAAKKRDPLDRKSLDVHQASDAESGRLLEALSLAGLRVHVFDGVRPGLDAAASVG